MKVDDELILKLESLAKLKLSTEERNKLMGELEKIIDMFSSISSLDTDGVEPLIHMTETYNQWREDEIGQHISTKDIAMNAPLMVGSFIAVPKVIE